MECIAFNRGTCARVADWTGLSLEQCVIREDACAVCKTTWSEDTPPTCNKVIASISIQSVKLAGKPDAEVQEVIQKSLPYITQQAYHSPAQVPCIYRGALLEMVTCKPCQSGNGTGLVPVFECLKHQKCTLNSTQIKPRIQGCGACQDRDDGADKFKAFRINTAKPTKLILEFPLSPGDVMTGTVALRSLHESYPGKFVTDIRGTATEIWQNNPYVTAIPDDDPDATRIKMEYPSVNYSNGTPATFITGYTHYLGAKLGVQLRAMTNRPEIYLSEEEKGWLSQYREHATGGKDVPYWVINAGTKPDFTAKQWPWESFQDVVDLTRGKVNWVQIGELGNGHRHPALQGVTSFVGKTDHRQLFRLVYHSVGCLGPVTYLQHVAAAFEKPYICLLGGREPQFWTTYPLQHTFHTHGLLPCCQKGACWKSRVVPLGDGDEKDNNLCERPVVGLTMPVGECMAMIDPKDVAQKVLEIARAV